MRLPIHIRGSLLLARIMWNKTNLRNCYVSVKVITIHARFGVLAAVLWRLKVFDMFWLVDVLEGRSDVKTSLTYPSTECNIPECLNLQMSPKIMFWRQDLQGNLTVRIKWVRNLESISWHGPLHGASRSNTGPVRQRWRVRLSLTKGRAGRNVRTVGIRNITQFQLSKSMGKSGRQRISWCIAYNSLKQTTFCMNKKVSSGFLFMVLYLKGHFVTEMFEHSLNY